MTSAVALPYVLLYGMAADTLVSYVEMWDKSKHGLPDEFDELSNQVREINQKIKQEVR